MFPYLLIQYFVEYIDDSLCSDSTPTDYEKIACKKKVKKEKPISRLNQIKNKKQENVVTPNTNPENDVDEVNTSKDLSQKDKRDINDLNNHIKRLSKNMDTKQLERIYGSKRNTNLKINKISNNDENNDNKGLSKKSVAIVGSKDNLEILSSSQKRKISDEEEIERMNNEMRKTVKLSNEEIDKIDSERKNLNKFNHF